MNYSPQLTCMKCEYKYIVLIQCGLLMQKNNLALRRRPMSCRICSNHSQNLADEAVAHDSLYDTNKLCLHDTQIVSIKTQTLEQILKRRFIDNSYL